MAKDLFHDIVRRALEKDGWSITHDPFTLLDKEEGGLQTDLGAEKIIIAEKEMKRIAVEVKSFVNPSLIHDFLTASGQYNAYLQAIDLKKINRLMFLAMPDYVYNRLINKEIILKIIGSLSMNIILYDPVSEVITAWKE